MCVTLMLNFINENVQELLEQLAVSLFYFSWPRLEKRNRLLMQWKSVLYESTVGCISFVLNHSESSLISAGE